MQRIVEYKEVGKRGELTCTAGFDHKEHWLLKTNGSYTFLFLANENDPYSHLKYVKLEDGSTEVVAGSHVGDTSQLEFFFDEQCAFVEDEDGKPSVDKARAYLAAKIGGQKIYE